MQKENLTIVLSGAAGQGLKTLETLITEMFHKEGFYVFASKEYMSRVRGGNNTVSIRVGKDNYSAYSNDIDLLIILNNNAIERLKDNISESTIIMGQSKDFDENYSERENSIDIEISEYLEKLGSKIYLNILFSGIINKIFNLDSNLLEKSLTKMVESKGKEILEKNLKALKYGVSIGRKLGFTCELSLPKSFDNKKMLTGKEAIGIGAIGAGCNFISSYPMSPSTGVLNFLAHNSEDFDIVYEQAEDEISAINMCLGAWYAGGRAIVTTSGGGFALMEEGLSLSGITETPAVIHLAQRPGPATGLPTRTSQGDLNLTKYGGHGDFPRFIFAPGNIEQGIEVTSKAFYLADKYQVPVIILTDQYYMDNYYTFDKNNVTFNKKCSENHIVKSKKDYKRYSLEENISPRSIPNFGKGFVCVDSDEHDENGRITEDFEMRDKMMKKRMSKLNKAEEDFIKPLLIGEENYDVLLIAWGSNLGVLEEVISKSSEKIAALHCRQLIPISPEIIGYIRKSKKVYVIENNYTGQFADSLEQEFHIEIKNRILQSNGMPFSANTILNKINEE